MDDDQIFYSNINDMLATHRARKPKLSKKDVQYALNIFMEQHDLTQEDMAKKLEVTRFQIIRWAKGATMPNRAHIRRMKELRVV